MMIFKAGLLALKVRYHSIALGDGDHHLGDKIDMFNTVTNKYRNN